jgi:enoyl-CoA hydratase/carnithine racemase/SAM-dependent methyltransferase/acyl carrier protein
VKIQSKLLIRDTDPLVREHRVEDIHILPGVSMLDAVYKTLAAARCPAETVVLRDIRFHEPVVTHEAMDRKLTITVELDEQRGEVLVESQPWKGEQPISASFTTHMTCRLERVAETALAPLAPVAVEGGTDLDACYAVTRQVGIYHDSFMKCLGTVAREPCGDIVAEVRLGSRAAARSQDFLLHPVFLDCSTIVPLFNLRERIDTASLFIPFSIEEFSTRTLRGQTEARVRVRRPESDGAEQEILHHDFEILDRSGRVLARFKKFAVKRVRSLGNVRQLLNSGASARLADAPETAPSAAAPQGGDALAALITGLIAHHGKIAPEEIDPDSSFMDFSLDSLDLLDISESLEKTLGVRLYPTLLFEHSSVAALSHYLRASFPSETAALGGAPASAPPADSAPTASQENAPEILVPLWQPVAVESAAVPAQGAVALLGGVGAARLLSALAGRLGSRVCHVGDASQGPGFLDAFAAALGQGLAFEELWLVGADHELAFSLVQRLIQARRLETPLVLRAITQGAMGVLDEAPRADAGHGLWGLLQTVSREYPATRVVQLDVPAEAVESLDWLAPLEIPALPGRRLLAWRDGVGYERRLFRAQAIQPAQPAFREGGAYLVIGGMGGVGLAFLRHVRQRYGARVAVLGRRPLDAVRDLLAGEGEYGRDLLYIQGSADSAADLARAIAATRAQFGNLHGIAHSAMVLDDCRLAEMSDASFAQVLQPKVTGIQALARATEGLQLDGLWFFSSVQSFIGNLTQGNYAAASTYLDGYAAALRAQRGYPVTVINWGYWSEVGAVASETYRRLLERQGVHGLRAEDALAALEQVVANGWEQAAIVSAEPAVLAELGLSEAFHLEKRGTAPLPAPVPVALPAAELETARQVFAASDAAVGELTALARRRVAHILGAMGDGHYAREHRALARVLDSLVAETPEPLAAEAFEAALARLVEQNPSLGDYAPLLRACLAAYPEILAGRRPAHEVVFPEGRMDLVRAVYERSPVSAFYNDLVARAARAQASGQAGAPLRILEIGAGTGATSRAVLDRLREAGIACEYWYTDLWDKLVGDARERLGADYPELRFRFLDIGTNPRSQGLLESFDMVVATNVIHASRDLRLALRHAKLLLRRGGALILNESVQVQEYSTYTFGVLPGWWGAVDSELRLPDSPLASRATWRRLLREEGFAKVHSLAEATADATLLKAQEVFLAVSDGELRLAPQVPRLSVVPAPEPAPLALPAALQSQLQPLDLARFDGVAPPEPRYLRLYEDARHNLWLFLDNPPANTYTEESLGELCGFIDWLRLHPEALADRILYFSHLGEYFSIGGDRAQIVGFLSQGRPDALRSFADRARQLLAGLATLDALVIAVVAGSAQGGGLESLFATDLQVVGKAVKLGLPEIHSGLIPGMGGLSYLAEQVGLPWAKRLVLCGELISAGQAHDLGLISHLADDPYAEALALAGRLTHLDAALHAKRLLGGGLAERLTADIDAWFDYVTQHPDWIDIQRIADSSAVAAHRAARAAGQSSP